MADEAVSLGPSSSSAETYLDAKKIIAAALSTGADAVHPGYGFLSENPEFAKLCSANGIVFIGPSADVIDSLGSKSEAKRILTERVPNVPLVPGYSAGNADPEFLIKECERIGFPVLIKASNGGGGKGMRIVRSTENLKEEILAAKGEALRNFGSDALLIEKFLEQVKHIEVQIIGDKHGNVYHLFERECSVQRRHQKVIEETPSPLLAKRPHVLKKILDAAVAVGKCIGYENAGTVEFIYDISKEDGGFYFLEVNTRLQVEHPITEAITGLDLVELQIMVAEGYNLKDTIGNNVIKRNGHAIECRLYAEDPDNNFYPSTGSILCWHQLSPMYSSSFPASSSAQLPSQYPRYDTGIDSGSEISVYYDPMIAKLTIWAPTRDACIRRMQDALLRTVCIGVTNNKKFLLDIMNRQEFTDGTYTTHLIEKMLNVSTKDSNEGFVSVTPSTQKKLVDAAPHRSIEVDSISEIRLNKEQEAALVATLWNIHKRSSNSVHSKFLPIGWRPNGIQWKPSSEEFLVSYSSQIEPVTISVEYIRLGNSFDDPSKQHHLNYDFRIVKKSDKIQKATPWFNSKLIASEKSSSLTTLTIQFGITRKKYQLVHDKSEEDKVYIDQTAWPKALKLVRKDPLASLSDASQKDDTLTPYTSSMPCRILKIMVKTGDQVKKGENLLTLESMKMEVRLQAQHDGLVTVNVQEGEVVEAGTLMVKIDTTGAKK